MKRKQSADANDAFAIDAAITRASCNLDLDKS
jgi:hypothetical protein